MRCTLLAVAVGLAFVGSAFGGGYMGDGAGTPYRHSPAVNTGGTHWVAWIGGGAIFVFIFLIWAQQSAAKEARRRKHLEQCSRWYRFYKAHHPDENEESVPWDK